MEKCGDAKTCKPCYNIIVITKRKGESAYNKKVKKTYAVLSLYQDLIEGKKLNIYGVCNDYKISLSTFHRYIAIIREFLWERKKQEVVYDKVGKFYYIFF